MRISVMKYFSGNFVQFRCGGRRDYPRLRLPSNFTVLALPGRSPLDKISFVRGKTVLTHVRRAELLDVADSVHSDARYVKDS